MLAIPQKRRPKLFIVGTICAVLIFGAGAYVLLLTASPSLGTFTVMRPINVSSLPLPNKTDNRIVIPKIGVDIAYAPGAAALDRGAEWRYPDRGNPQTGGNFIIAAHRLSIQPTPLGTIEKSPFYNIDKLLVGDKIIIDYQGQRYAYEINTIFNVTPNQTEIEAPSSTPKLTLYSCQLDGSSAGRVVINAKPLGQVAVNQ